MFQNGSSTMLKATFSCRTSDFLPFVLRCLKVVMMCTVPSGLPNTSGLLGRKNVIADRDADVVTNLQRAGAIPVGLTNCSELCMWYESSNLIYGRCNNAYHVGRTVGGSSGKSHFIEVVFICRPTESSTTIFVSKSKNTPHTHTHTQTQQLVVSVV